MGFGDQGEGSMAEACSHRIHNKVQPIGNDSVSMTNRLTLRATWIVTTAHTATRSNSRASSRTQLGSVDSIVAHFTVARRDRN